MKKLITVVLTTALVFSGIAAPVKQADAMSNGEVYTDVYGWEYTYFDGYYEGQDFETPEIDGYKIMNLYKVTPQGTPGMQAGSVWYDKDGSVAYKEADDKVLIDKRRVEKINLYYNQWNATESDLLTPTLLIGETANLSIEAEPYHNEKYFTINWSSSNNNIATVDKNGKVKGKKAGNATITAAIKPGGKKVTIGLKVIKNQYIQKQTNVFGDNITNTAYYDKSGNLKCKISYKSKRKLSNNSKKILTNKIYVKGKLIKKFEMDVSAVKKNKTKTKTYTIKNVKFVTLLNPEDFQWYISLKM